MRKRQSAVFLMAATLVALATVGVVPPRPALAGQARQEVPGGVSNPRETLQSKLDALTLAGAPGAVARLDEGPRHWTATAGVGDLTSPSPLPPGARFRVGSITKTFVATVVLQLVEEGRVTLDSAVSQWVPDLLPNGNEITVRHLLGHRSGLPEYLADPAIWQGIVENRVFRPEELVAAATARPLLFPPGTDWSYSNTNYIVAGLLAERVTGNPLEAELQRRIFGPLGLGHTSFPTTSARIDGVHAHGYVLVSPTEPLLDVTGINPSHAWAAGAVVSTAGDVSRFYRSLLDGALLGPEMLGAMMTTSPVTGDPVASYGLGLFRMATPCGVFWGHGGEIPGYHAWSFHAAGDSRRSLTEMVNLSPATSPALGRAVGALHNVLCERA